MGRDHRSLLSEGVIPHVKHPHRTETLGSEDEQAAGNTRSHVCPTPEPGDVKRPAVSCVCPGAQICMRTYECFSEMRPNEVRVLSSGLLASLTLTPPRTRYTRPHTAAVSRTATVGTGAEPLQVPSPVQPALRFSAAVSSAAVHTLLHPSQQFYSINPTGDPARKRTIR